jgi:hypothetical protein
LHRPRRYSRAQGAAEIGVWKVVPLAASPISVQSSVLPAGPDNAQNNSTGDPELAVPVGAQLGAMVPVQVTVWQLLVRLIVTNPAVVPMSAVPTV